MASGVAELVEQALEAVRSIDVSDLGEVELEELIGATVQLEGATVALGAEALAAYDRVATWESCGARSVSRKVAVDHRLPTGQVAERLKLGRKLVVMPAVAQAWRSGHIDLAHVRLLAKAHKPHRAEAFAEAQAMLVDHARTLGFDSFQRCIDYWILRADADGAADDAAKLRKGRRAHHSRTLKGSWAGSWDLDPIAGTVLDRELRQIYDQLYQHDVAEARQKLGRDPRPDELARTPAQRRADALVEMARRSAGARDERTSPLFEVLVDADTFFGQVCETIDGTVIEPRSLKPWLDGAIVRRVVFGAGGTRIEEIGHRRRIFDGILRDAVLLRDRGCRDPYCDVKAGDPACRSITSGRGRRAGPPPSATARPAAGPTTGASGGRSTSTFPDPGDPRFGRAYLEHVRDRARAELLAERDPPHRRR